MSAPCSKVYKQLFFVFPLAAGGQPLSQRRESGWKGSPRGALPLRGYPARPDWGEGRGGKDKIQLVLEVLQKRVRILEMGTAAITGVYARGLFHKNRLDNTRAGREQKIHCAGRSGCTPGSLQNWGSPRPRGGQDAFRGKL